MRLLEEKLAIPDGPRRTVPRIVLPSMNVTEPAAGPAALVTLAASVASSPKVIALGDEVSVVVVRERVDNLVERARGARCEVGISSKTAVIAWWPPLRFSGACWRYRKRSAA